MTSGFWTNSSASAMSRSTSASERSLGWPAIALAVATFGLIVWFGIDFSARLSRMEGQLTILLQAVRDGRSAPERLDVPVLPRGAATAPGNTPPQDVRNRPGS